MNTNNFLVQELTKRIDEIWNKVHSIIRDPERYIAGYIGEDGSVIINSIESDRTVNSPSYINFGGVICKEQIIHIINGDVEKDQAKYFREMANNH